MRSLSIFIFSFIFSAALVMSATAEAQTQKMTDTMPPPGAPPERVEPTEREKLDEVITQYTEAAKRLDPYYAPFYGVEDDLADFGDFLSAEHRERAKTIRKAALNALKPIMHKKMTGNDLILYRLFKQDLEHGLAYYDLPLYLYDNFTQMDNRFRSYIDDSSPALTSFPFDSKKHYEDFIERSEGFPPFVDRQIQTFKDAQKKGYVLNCTIAKSALNTYQEALVTDIEKNPFYRPVLSMPSSITKAEQKEIRAAFKKMISERILPAFQKFDQYYRETYIPKCRKSYGIGALPKGDKLYSFLIRHHTDLKLSANEVHKTGLREVARIAGEMEKIKTELKFEGTLQEFLKSLIVDEKYYFKNAKDMFAAFMKYKKVVDAKIPQYFSLVPTTNFVMAESENPEDAAASYRMPTDFQPFGRFVVNTKNLKGVPTYGVETLYLHEAIPGHHFQLALQYELKETLSEYQRKVFSSNAFAEGWALYVERLGRDEGWLSSPMQRMGSLSDEMLRAVRLVVDSGIHSKGWSREKTIEYMQTYLAADIRDIEIEADRYSVWPGQALAYKTGQLKILELRDFAKKQLGQKFDIKEFHKQVLQNGMVSLEILDTVIKDWVKKAKLGEL